MGSALPPFEAIGRARTTDGDTVIDAGSVMYDGTPINGPADLRAFLLGYEDQFVRNVIEKLLTYALGRGVEYYDMPVVRAIAAQAAEDDYRFAALIIGVVQSEPFRSSRKSDGVVAGGTVTPEATAALN